MARTPFFSALQWDASPSLVLCRAELDNELEQVRDFIQLHRNEDVFAPSSERMSIIRDIDGHMFALLMVEPKGKTSVLGSTYVAPLADDPTCHEREVSGVLLKPELRGSRIIDLSEANGRQKSVAELMVTLAVSYALFDLIANGNGVETLAQMPAPISCSYNTLNTAVASRKIGRRLGFCCQTDAGAHPNWFQLPVVSSVMSARASKLGPEKPFQFAHLGSSYPPIVGQNMVAALDASGLRVALSKEGVSYPLFFDESVFRQRAEFRKWLAGGKFA